MFTCCSGLMMTLTIIATSGTDENGYIINFAVRGKVLDVFENNKILVSFGKEQGAKTGQCLAVYRLNPSPIYVGDIEVTEVGTRHSICRFTGYSSASAKPLELNDLVSPRVPPGVWRSMPDDVRKLIQRNEDLLKALEHATLVRRLQARYGWGGAIEATIPKDQK